MRIGLRLIPKESSLAQHPDMSMNFHLGILINIKFFKSQRSVLNCQKDFSNQFQIPRNRKKLSMGVG